ncbi:probable glutathione S-transferase 9 isoform X1 [Ruditapes philippinarum]|uniref:probable glutathione S-transferase 9 isoform X1 n=1 Tax=Ruditapes philippinarum TaxID=129788 RepID=UPI00295B97BB|nr:probable glutathione S-transferase 9 isoform X1 [Ruditapes philippinarum]
MNGSKKDSIRKYKLTYFDIRGRGEIPRLLFHAAEVEFTDDRIDSEEKWYNSLKAKMPQRVLPVLEVDGKLLSQSLTICRYLAREFGLCGKTSWEQALVEQVVDTMDDLRAEVAKWIYEKDTEKKDEIGSHLRSEIYPKFFGILEDILKENEENNNRSGYLVGDSLTLADLSVFETFTFPLSIHPDILDDHLELQEHRKRIETHKHLADYIKNRPVRPV